MGKMADRHIFGNELCEIGKTRDDFVVLNADTKACNLEKFGELFPERAFTVGIAEQDMVDIAAGLAACGNKVFISTFAVFAAMRACEQVRTFICHTNLNVTILGTHTGLQVGGDGATHAAVEDVGIMRTFPNMTIIRAAAETGAVLTVEDHNVINGLGAAVASVTAENYPVPVTRRSSIRFAIWIRIPSWQRRRS
ncbi:transketolase family protein [[Clostridium] aminophilum]|uniref:transketolase family protein n=1 Tax=[Clostridium] aminophilum TaxID=1526 RepID=UPI003F9CA392